MRLYQTAQETSAVIAQLDSDYYNISAGKAGINKIRDLLRASNITDLPLRTVVKRLIEGGSHRVDEGIIHKLQVPAMPDEVWAAGVTYEISEKARRSESHMPEMYMDVYDAERPELFLKSTPDRTVGHGDDIGIRSDSEWNVPEPELGVVLFHGEVVGYTIGNDVSSRSIEGENPLYLPQAKVFDRACALGPCFVDATSIDPLDLEIEMEIAREGDVIFSDSTSTKYLNRSITELVEHCVQSDVVPEVMVLLTGTSLVPDDEFTLHQEDQVAITVSNIGTLTNSVRIV